MKTAWIVDDDEEMGRAVELMLKLLGFRPEVLLRAGTALKRLQGKEKPDLLVVDVYMPEINGLELTAAVRRQPGLPNLPIVILTTDPADTLADQAISLGADACLTKPVSLEELQAAIRSAFQAHGGSL